MRLFQFMSSGGGGGGGCIEGRERQKLGFGWSSRKEKARGSIPSPLAQSSHQWTRQQSELYVLPLCLLLCVLSPAPFYSNRLDWSNSGRTKAIEMEPCKCGA